MHLFRADLHCHSTCSDGTLSPEELVLLAVEKQLQGLSITDHDNFSAYPEVMAFAKEKGIRMIPGVEFSTEFKEKSVHILGYGFDISNEALLALCKRHKSRRHGRNLEILHNLKKEGFHITEEELLASKSTSIGRPHIAHLMVEKGFVPDIRAAFNRYLGDGKSCFARGEPLTIEETLHALHAGGGVAVLAHPHLYHSKKFVKHVLQHSFDGIECFYANMHHDQNAPWAALAEELELIKTGGSDFHGTSKPGIQLGASWTEEATFNTMLGDM